MNENSVVREVARLFEQFSFDKWSPCRSYENDGPRSGTALNSFFYFRIL